MASKSTKISLTAGFGHLLVLISLCLVESPGEAFAKENELTFYTRYNTYQQSSSVINLNGVYEFRLAPFLNANVGVRAGETQGNFSQYNYKAEVKTKKILGFLSFLERITKINSFYPANESKSVWINQARAVLEFRPFVWNGSFGATYASSGSNASVWLPSFDLQSGWIPTYLTSLALLNEPWHQEYILKFGNYDIFDVYSPSSSYFQFDLEQQFHDFVGFAYARWRYKQSDVTNLNSFYVALGVIFSLGSPGKHDGAAEDLKMVKKPPKRSIAERDEAAALLEPGLTPSSSGQKVDSNSTPENLPLLKNLDREPGPKDY